MCSRSIDQSLRCNRNDKRASRYYQIKDTNPEDRPVAFFRPHPDICECGTFYRLYNFLSIHKYSILSCKLERILLCRILRRCVSLPFDRFAKFLNCLYHINLYIVKSFQVIFHQYCPGSTQSGSIQKNHLQSSHF